MALFFTLQLVVSLILAKVDSELVPTYFARKYKNGSYVDATMQSNRLEISLHSMSIERSSVAMLKVEPSLVKNAQYAVVSWEGVVNAQAIDFVALYCPETSANNDYYDYFEVGESPTYRAGFGNRSVQLYNVRTNCEMRYFRKDILEKRQELVAKSNIIIFEGGPEMPLQIHLALTGDPTEMRVMWVSGTGKYILVIFFLYV